MTIQKFIKNWLPVILWAGMIFYLSSIPNLHSGLPDMIDIVLRKIAHAGEFGILAILLLRAALSLRRKQNNQPPFNIIIIVIVIVFLYAILDEIHQHFTAGRVASPIDVLIDGIGAVLGIAIWRRISLPKGYRLKAISSRFQ